MARGTAVHIAKRISDRTSGRFQVRLLSTCGYGIVRVLDDGRRAVHNGGQVSKASRN
jgi:hypothetical protein